MLILNSLWSRPRVNLVENAVTAAKEADVTVLVLGIVAAS